jgi:hypothetical protein
MVGIVFSSGIRDVARFEAAKNILERYFAERQKPEIPVSFSPWGNNDGTFSTFLQVIFEVVIDIGFHDAQLQGPTRSFSLGSGMKLRCNTRIETLDRSLRTGRPDRLIRR